MNSAALFLSATDEWSTPDDLFARLAEIFPFELDVCATPTNAKCPRYFTREQDGLVQVWRGVCWMNPPYGREIGKWIAKADASAKAGATVVCLIPARTDTAWWHAHVQPIVRGERAGDIEFLRGRLKFGGATSGAPFPSVIVVFLPGAA